MEAGLLLDDSNKKPAPVNNFESNSVPICLTMPTTSSTKTDTDSIINKPKILPFKTMLPKPFEQHQQQPQQLSQYANGSHNATAVQRPTNITTTASSTDDVVVGLTVDAGAKASGNIATIENGEMDEASSLGTSVTGWRGPAPYRCGHCHQVSNWKHVIQVFLLTHNTFISILYFVYFFFFLHWCGVPPQMFL